MAYEKTQSKPWWQSKTVWGLAITGISVFAPKYQPLAQALPPVVGDIGALAGLLLGLYGRAKANKPITTS